MRLFLLLVTAPLVVAFTQPPVQPTRSIAAVDSHLVRHPKTKLAAARVKSSAVNADAGTTARSTPTVATPMPAVHPATKARKP